MSMRVIAGIYRHRNLKYPEDNKGIRPTKDRIKEAFFSAIGDISGKSFLDLCAGCGGMGIEAISRGAQKSTFVDNNKISLGFIKDNLLSLGISNYEITNSDVMLALEKFKQNNQKFDVIYFDPPYEFSGYLDVISYIYNNDLVNDGGILAFEANKKIEINNDWYSQNKEYHYGDITVTVLRK